MQVPEHLVQLSNDREHRKHRVSQIEALAPIFAAEDCAGHFLPRTKAVEDGTTGEAAVTKHGMDAATEVVLEVHAWVTGRLIEREID